MRNPRHKLLVLIMIILVAVFTTGPAGAEGDLPEAQRFQLENGLKVIIKENHAVPVAALQIWVKAGSIYETDQEAGITHFIEHMIFKGSEKYGPGEMARIIESAGGEINAYTSYDYTVYHVVIGSKFFNAGLDTLSDAVLEPRLDAEEIEREKKVILEEVSMRRDQPGVRLYEEIMSRAYDTAPYRRPVIGFPETVRSVTRDLMLAYMKRRYVPSSITVVVVGDVKTAECLPLIKEKFARMSGGPADVVHLEEARTNQVRTVFLKDDISESHLALCFPIPGFNDPDNVALDLLAAVLGDGESSRLYRELRGKRTLVNEVGAYSFTPLGPGLLEVACTLEPGQIPEALKTVLRESYRLRFEKVDQEELDRAKLKIESEFVYAQEKVEGQARKLGYFENMAGDFHEQATYLRRLAAVMPEDVRRVAEKYLDPKRIVFGLLASNGASVPITPQDVETLSLDAEQTLRAFYAGAKEESSEVRKYTLRNGATLLVKRVPSVPTVAVQAVFLGGLRGETPATNGSYNMMVQLWTKGTKTRNAEELAAEIEGMAGSITGFSGKNTFGLSGTFLSRFFARGFHVFSDIMINPAFAKEELEKLRPVLLAQLKAQEDSLPALTFLNFSRLLYEGYPYALNPLGTCENIRRFSAQEIRKIRKNSVVPGNLVLSVVGDVEESVIREVLEKEFSAWKAGEFKDRKPKGPAAIKKPRIAAVPKPKQQVHIALGFPGGTLYDPDRAALDVLNMVLSGQGGRLFTELRDKESLAYNVTAFSTEGMEAGSFGVYIAAAPEKEERAVQSLWRELKRVLNEEIAAAELDRAKRYIIGNTEIDLQTNSAQAMDMALYERYSLGYDFTRRYLEQIDKVSVEDVHKAARKYIRPGKYVLVKVGPDVIKRALDR
ncbi:MAG: pitrilysin family protein [Pseudomonadota bacterium]